MGQFLDLDDYGKHLGGIIVDRLKKLLDEFPNMRFGLRIELGVDRRPTGLNQLAGPHLNVGTCLVQVLNLSADTPQPIPFAIDGIGPGGQPIRTPDGKPMDPLEQVDKALAAALAAGSPIRDESEGRQLALQLLATGAPLGTLMAQAVGEAKENRRARESAGGPPLKATRREPGGKPNPT